MIRVVRFAVENETVPTISVSDEEIVVSPRYPGLLESARKAEGRTLLEVSLFGREMFVRFADGLLWYVLADENSCTNVWDFQPAALYRAGKILDEILAFAQKARVEMGAFLDRWQTEEARGQDPVE